MSLPEYVPSLHPGPRGEEAYRHYRLVRGHPWKVTERAFLDTMHEIDPYLRSLASLEAATGNGSFERVLTMGEEDILQELRCLLAGVLRGRRTRNIRTVTALIAAVYEGFLAYRRREVREGSLSLAQGLIVGDTEFEVPESSGCLGDGNGVLEDEDGRCPDGPVSG